MSKSGMLVSKETTYIEFIVYILSVLRILASATWATGHIFYIFEQPVNLIKTHLPLR